MLSEQSLYEFKQIYLKKFGVELSEEETLSKATSLLSLYQAMLRQNMNMRRKDNEPSKHSNTH